MASDQRTSPGPFCACGCGERTKLRTSRFIQGHAARHRFAALADRLFQQVDKSGDCWLWTGRFDKDSGYARMRVGRGRREGVHRLSWMLANGREIPKDCDICHKCDTPLCVRPDHLFVGSPLDNARDKVSKNRQPRGTTNAAARLTDAQVAEILTRPRDRGMLAVTAREFGVSTSTIKQIRAGRIWRHLTRGAA